MVNHYSKKSQLDAVLYSLNYMDLKLQDYASNLGISQ